MVKNIKPRLLLFSRRRLLQIIMLAGLPVKLWANNDKTLSKDEVNTLIQIAHLLFPHKGLPVESYQNVVNKILNSRTTTILQNGIKQLNAVKGQWLKLSEAKQIAVLKSIETTDFFQLMYETTLSTLYRDPKLWRIIDYEGSAIEHGGYLHRGFNDIDWLPSNE